MEVTNVDNPEVSGPEDGKETETVVDGATEVTATAPAQTQTIGEVAITVLEVEGDVQTDNVKLYVPKDALNVSTGSTINGQILPISPDLSLLVLGGGTTMLAFGVEEIQGDDDTTHQEINVPKTAVGGAPFGTVLTATKYEPPSGSVLVIALTS